MPAADQTQTASVEKIRTNGFANAVSGHLLRVTFIGKAAAIGEVEISGHLTAQ
jgi:hypothetical protein